MSHEDALGREPRGKFGTYVWSAVAKLASAVSALCRAPGTSVELLCNFIKLKLSPRIYFFVHSQSVESGLACFKPMLWSAAYLLCIFLVTLEKSGC